MPACVKPIKVRTYGKCPVCKKGHVIKSRNGHYYCDNRSAGKFHFFLWHHHRRFEDEIEMTDEKVRTLLQGGNITETIHDRDGVAFDAPLYLDIVEARNRIFVNLAIRKEYEYELD